MFTARDEGLAVEGVELLRASGVPFDGFCCAAEKVELCGALGATALVDDDVDLLRRARRVGLPTFALRHPHNAAVLDELAVPHASGWRGLHRLLSQSIHRLRG